MTTGPSPGPTAVETPSPTPDQALTELLSHIPADIVATCRQDKGFDELTDDLRAAAVCEPSPSFNVDTIHYLLYDSDSAMDAAYDYVVDEYTSGKLPKNSSCTDGPARGRWVQASVDAGSYACYESDTSGVRLWWTADGTAILSRASDKDMSVPEIWQWFLDTSTGPL